MAVNDFYKLVAQYEYLGTIQQNRFYYRQQSGADTEAEHVANAFLDDVYPAIQAVQHEDCNLIQLTSINLNNPIDFYETAVTGANGDIGGEATAPFTAWYFKLLRESREFRPGRKAIGGVSESSVAAGMAILAVEPALNTCADALAGNINPPLATGNVYSPHLVREVVGVPPTEFTRITGCQYVGVSTQNTRKFNRGL